MKERGPVYGAEICGELLLRRCGMLGVREIGERVGLHLSAVGNAVQRITERPTRTMVRSLKELESRIRNQAS